MRADPNRPNGSLAARLAARVVDVLAVFFMMFALVIVHALWFVPDASDRFHPRPWGASFVPTVVFVVLYGVYDVAFTKLQGQTPGKLLMNVRVVQHGTEVVPGWHRALARWALPGLLMLTPGVLFAVLAVLLTGVTAPFTRGRAVHDLLAGTGVQHYDIEAEQGPLDVPTRRKHSAARRLLARSSAAGRPASVEVAEVAQVVAAEGVRRPHRPHAERGGVLEAPSGASRRGGG